MNSKIADQSLVSVQKRTFVWKLLRAVVLIYGAKKVIQILRSWYIRKRALSKARYLKSQRHLKTAMELNTILSREASDYPDEALELKILQTDVVGLIEMLESKETTSKQLMLVFLKQCLKRGTYLNAITDICYKEAFVMAQECDRRRAEGHDNLPCLFGIPVSIKGTFQMRGTDSSLGLSTKYGSTSTEDGLFVKIIKEEFGAIPFVKTVVPSGLMGTETENHIYGDVLNPYNKKRTSGGSSGGEAALIASGCSPLGFGCDTAGSIRTPSLFCGVYGYMISPDRVTRKGLLGNQTGFDMFVKECPGIIGKSVRDLRLVVKNFVSNEFMEEQDFYLEHFPWKVALAEKPNKFKIAILPESPYFELTQPQKRVMLSVIDKLGERGHEIVPFTFPKVQLMSELFLKIANVLLTESMESYKNDYLTTELEKKALFESLPNWARNLLHWTAENTFCSQRVAHLSKTFRPITRDAFLATFEEIQVLTDDVNLLFDKDNIDCILIPGLSVAYKHHTAYKLAATHSGHIFPNSTSMCAGVVPIDVMVQEEEGFKDRANDYLTDSIRDNLKGGAGLPLGVQVCSRKHRDERCLLVMEEIENIFQFKGLKL